jgi:protein-S-isoprenylcysteine O-methyltransferase Ste14
MAPQNAARAQISAFLLVLAVALFGPAGRLDLPSFWIYIAMFAAICAAGLVFVDPSLAQERLRPGGEHLQAPQILTLLVILAHWIIAGLDRGRLQWSDHVPIGVQLIGFLLAAASLSLVTWAAHENRYASSGLRIQTERGHHVITTGPYAFVRHPSYLGAFVLFPTSGMALGSWLAAAWGALFIPLLLWGTAKEDRFLFAELPGYDAYVERVRYRLVPGVW